MENTDKPATPWHFWLVGILGLLFTSIGALDYIVSQTGNRELIEMIMGTTGTQTDAVIDYIAGFPIWADFFWGLGVWSAIAGSVALLFRSRFAFHLYALSLVGLVVANGHSLANPMPDTVVGPENYIPVIIIFVVMLALTLYARVMARRGVLG